MRDRIGENCCRRQLPTTPRQQMTEPWRKWWKDFKVGRKKKSISACAVVREWYKTTQCILRDCLLEQTEGLLVSGIENTSVCCVARATLTRLIIIFPFLLVFPFQIAPCFKITEIIFFVIAYTIIRLPLLSNDGDILFYFIFFDKYCWFGFYFLAISLYIYIFSPIHQMIFSKQKYFSALL